MQFETANGVLIARNGGEMLRIEPWGKNSLRVHFNSSIVVFFDVSFPLPKP